MNSSETFSTKIFYKIGFGSGFYYLSSSCDLILTTDSSLSMPVKFYVVAGQGKDFFILELNLWTSYLVKNFYWKLPFLNQIIFFKQIFFQKLIFKQI